MKDKDQVRKLDQKVLFIRISEDIYKDIESLAKKEERSINWMSTNLLKKALASEAKTPPHAS
jgi:hypothetical protein